MKSPTRKSNSTKEVSKIDFTELIKKNNNLVKDKKSNRSVEKQKLKEIDDKYAKFESQSDIIIGGNFNQEFEIDERENYSDFHDMLFVDDLFSDS